MMNYKALQTTVKNLIVNDFEGIACTIRFLDGTSVSTYMVFDGGKFANIDNRQNPTPIIGLTQQKVYIPGDITYAPDARGQLEYYVGTTKNIKSIESFTAVQPTNIPLLYVLVVE